MKKNAFPLCLLLSLCMSTNMLADHRTPQQALQIAQSKAQSLGIEASMPNNTRRIIAAGKSTTLESPYYVFNNGGDHGWTVVSGDDRMPDVLAYSDKGSLDMDNLPDAVKDIMSSFETSYYNLESSSSAAKTARKSAAMGTTNLAIGPLCVTTWDQFEPYYNLTPLSDGTHCATCCVATVIAQILYYLYHTQAGQSSTTFANSIESQHGVVNGPRTYEWDKMLHNYTGTNYTEEQATEIATLMRDVGYALNANYGVKVSTAYIDQIKRVVSTYFGLDGSKASYEDYSDVEDLYAAIDAELNTYHPVMVCGSGHSFICDGRDASGQYYHFNFGYSGGGNGFYCSDAYNGYGKEMYLTTGLRLADTPATPESATEKLRVVYNSAVKTAGLRPVGAIPGFYQQTYYESLMTYLASAKAVLNESATMSDTEILTLIDNIGIAEQKMISYTTPYADDWYYINTAVKFNGEQCGLRYYSQGAAIYTALYSGMNTVQKFKFVYDEASNGYYISNYGATRYLVGMPGYGKDPTWTSTVADKVPCEVVTTDRIGDTEQYMITIRPMAEGYKDDNSHYLCAWTNNTSTSWECSSGDTPYWVYGGDPYGGYSKWTLTSVTTKTTPEASFEQSNISLAIDDVNTQTVLTNSDGNVTYSSNDITVATVDASTGAVSAVGEGTATITAAISASDSYAAAVATYIVNVPEKSTAINAISTVNENVSTRKCIKNGRLVIINNGREFNAAGALLK